MNDTLHCTAFAYSECIVPSDVKKKLEKRRNKILELQATEENYVSILNYIVKVQMPVAATSSIFTLNHIVSCLHCLAYFPHSLLLAEQVNSIVFP